MSLSANHFGGQYRSPYTKSDRMKVGLGCFGIFAGIVLAVGLVIFG